MSIKIGGTTIIDDSQNATLTGTLTLSSTGAVKLPVGTTVQQPAPVQGQLRFNSDTVGFEGYNGTVWGAIGGSSASTDDISTDTTYYPSVITALAGSTLKTASSKLTFNPFTGTLYSTEFLSSSDLKLKDNVETLYDAVDVVNQIRPVSFNWKDSGHKSYGVIAQELEMILPELVRETNEGLKQVKYDALIGFLLGAIQELDTRLKNLEYK